MSKRPSFLSSTVGSKILIGLTGLLLFGFLITHLAGNLTVFGGAEAFNAYTYKLESTKPLLYVAEIGLVLIFLLHVVKTVTGYVRNRAARPVGYTEKRMAGYTSRKGVSSTSMILTGTVILVFVVIHVRAFKYGPHYVDASTGYRDLFRLLVESFQNPLVVGFYVVSMVLIGMHLNHGISSATQSLGLATRRSGRGLVLLGRVLALAIAGGFAILPIYLFLAY
jgi:succinate dehydrogenase / fumarate reductase cytochrome b subunit